MWQNQRIQCFFYWYKCCKQKTQGICYVYIFFKVLALDAEYTEGLVLDTVETEELGQDAKILLLDIADTVDLVAMVLDTEGTENLV